MIELVVFDMAGTTVHDGDAVNAAFRAALAAAGVSAEPALVNTVMGLHKPEAIRILLEHRGIETSIGMVDSIHDVFVARMKAHYASDPSVREVPEASAVFATLRRAGIKVALDTGFSREIADVILARLGWRSPDVIDATICSDEVSRGRPHPDMIQSLMAKLGVREPRRVAKVGDTQADLEEGTNAECGVVVGVTTGSFTKEQLSQHPHTHIVGSVAEVPTLLSFVRE